MRSWVNALYTGVGIALVFNGWSIYAVAVLMIAVAVVNLAIQLFFLRRFSSLHLCFEGAKLYHLLQSGWPYLLSSFFLVAYMQIDIIIISALVDEQSIGWGRGCLPFIRTFFIPRSILQPPSLSYQVCLCMTKMALSASLPKL
ncbi:MAG: oligosaccharide flippase family protein [Caldilineaceae bacterium]